MNEHLNLVRWIMIREHGSDPVYDSLEELEKQINTLTHLAYAYARYGAYDASKADELRKAAEVLGGFKNE